MIDDNEDFLDIFPYYVYELIDPINDEVFYVGKGTGRRGYDHDYESNNSNISNSKLDRIRKIKSEGNNHKVRVIGRYKTDQEAYAVESTLIHWIYGIDELCNIQSGHNSNFIRNKKSKDDLIRGIDIPLRIKLADGEYTKDQLEKLIVYQKDVYINSIAEYLNMYGFSFGIAERYKQFMRSVHRTDSFIIYIFTTSSKTEKVKIEIGINKNSNYGRKELEKFSSENRDLVSYVKTDGSVTLIKFEDYIEQKEIIKNVVEYALNIVKNYSVFCK